MRWPARLRAWRRGSLVVVHGAYCPSVPEPRVLFPEAMPAEVDDAELVHLARRERPAEGVLRLHDVHCAARFATDAAPGVRAGMIRTPAGRPVRGPSNLLDEPTRPLPREARSPGKSVRVDGRVGVLDLRGRSAENYFHWLVDALANRWLFEQAGFGDDAIDAYLIPSAGAFWQRESLELAGIDDGRVIRLADVDRVDADEFLLPVRAFGSGKVPSWIVQALRSPRRPGESRRLGAGRRLYVSRGAAARRRLTNEDAVVAQLADRGFEAVALDGMSVRDQRTLFAEADVIVAPHGAALTNLAWATPGCAVLELVPLARPNLCFFHLAHQAGATHHTVMCAPDEAGDDVVTGHGHTTVEVPLLVDLVDDVLAGAGG